MVSLVRREMAREPADSFYQEVIQSSSAGGGGKGGAVGAFTLGCACPLLWTTGQCMRS